MKEVSTFKVTGMSCQHCVNSINRAVLALNGVVDLHIDLQSKKVTVDFDADKISISTIKGVICDQGYEVE